MCRAHDCTSGGGGGLQREESCESRHLELENERTASLLPSRSMHQYEAELHASWWASQVPALLAELVHVYCHVVRCLGHLAAQFLLHSAHGYVVHTAFGWKQNLQPP
jgi:hypothetical protein